MCAQEHYSWVIYGNCLFTFLENFYDDIFCVAVYDQKWLRMPLFKYTQQYLLPFMMRLKKLKIFLIWVFKDETNDVEQTTKHLVGICVFLFKINKFRVFLVSNFCRVFICLLCILDIKVFPDNGQWFLSHLYVVFNLFIILYAVIKLLNSMGY